MTDSDGVVENSSEPDYSAVNLPDKPRSEYSYVQRRAELLQLIREAGHPRAISQTRLADEYDVSQQQISKDLDRLATHIHESVVENRDRRALTVHTVMQRAVRGLMDAEEYRKAAKTALEWDEWLQERHDLEELADRVAALEDAADGPGVETR